MKLTWQGHACFLLESDGYRVILDPCKGVPGVKDTAGEADAVYCSHSHFDHCYLDELRVTEKRPSPFAVCEIASFHDDAQGAKRGENTIRAFTAEGITVVHLGDLGHELSAEQVAEIGRCDVLLIPVGGTYTLDVSAAAQVAVRVKPRVIIPMHYRRGEMGFEVLQTVEEFAAQYDAQDVHWLQGNSLELNVDALERGGVVVLNL
ncbi:MAG: MBL fold metallo-hydrolase [Oscillospiraceae bacterium]|nr:MBL fold metallo-hydrolase [Oscillospiraceae bacterium]